ncbi:uncharacterized protein LOC134672285 [Cydia fagiglandana]|uniref:uncharacterized protein LOC134672285 n=1 Tax=Cydia fagiglandana TaxID=1458189 RepID=UPI002FEE6429
MNVVAKKQHRGKSLKLSFSIIYKYATSNEKLSEVFNIDDLAEVRFRFVSSTDTLSTFLSIKKHASAKDTAVKVDVKSEDLGYTQQWVCTEHWVDWQDMGVKPTMTAVDNYLVAFRINITLIEEKCFNAPNIYEDDDFTDFHLSTAEGRVAVHRVHLATHSEVFKTMLGHEWKETAEGNIQVEGVTLQTLKHLKQYIYLGTLPDDGLRQLLLIARYYLIDNLKSACISKLARTATPDNLEDLLEFAIDNKITELALAILQLTPDDVVDGAYQLKKKEPASAQTSGK